MRTNVIKTLIAFLAAGATSPLLERTAFAEPTTSSAVEQKLESESIPYVVEQRLEQLPQVSITPHLGFNYRALVKSPEIDAYVDKTRQEFEGSMPGMKNFMQLGRQLPYFTVGADITPTQWHILPRDKISFSVDFDFSTSAIFGGTEDKKTFYAKLSAFDFGDTPTVWKQHLDFWSSFNLGVKYSPHTFGNTFQVRPTIGAKVGFSYLQTSSVFSFHVNDPTIFDEIGYEALGSLNINRDSRTDATCKGWGYNLAASIGVELEYARWVLALKGGYAYNVFPSFRIDEHLVKNAPTPFAVTEDKRNTFKHDNSGLEGSLFLGRTFDLPF
ncbi:MAG: hypothetical protein WCV90_02505 [Candidatus Woesearchaeota archaeon]